MIDNVMGINFKGASFENDTTLQFFEEKNHKRICLLYGKNGTGKSTIARAFSKIKGEDEEKIIHAKLVDENENEITLADTDIANIHVFNESFIDNNVRLKEGGLGTIVMLGAQGQWDDKIKKEKEELTKCNDEFAKQKEIYEKYEGVKNDKAPETILNKISGVLKSDDGWASRDAYIRDKKQNSRVSDDTYKQFLDRKPEKKRDELIVLYANKKAELEQAKLGNGKIEISVIMNKTLSWNEDTVRELLAKKLEKPVFSEREKYLFSLLGLEGHEHIDQIALTMKNKENRICKFCLQPLKEEYKEGVLADIANILNKESEEHIVEISSYKLEVLIVDLSVYEKLSENVLKKCKKALDELNNAIEILNKSIEQKILNVYEPVIYNVQGLSTLFDNMQVAFNELESERIEYNKHIADIKGIKKELEKINSDIAYFDVKLLADEYEKAKSEKQSEFLKLQAITKRIEEHNSNIEQFEMQKQNVEIALDVINDGLKYIFFSENRFVIEYRDNQYILLSNGKTVKPSDISTGERNVIGLCYYFANIMSNKELDRVYGEEYLLVIDDPVSSFDFENKVGIMSYLKYQLSRFVLGNIDTKILFMTHDLQTCLDADKFIQEIMENCKIVFANTGKHSYAKRELVKQHLEEKNLEKHEYTNLVNIIYQFAKSEDEDDEGELIIGNVMRRVLEAFSTFEYRKSIHDVSNDKSILNTIEEPYRDYYENLMYRLVLNGESHLKDRVTTMSDLNFFEVITLEQKRRTARDVLGFIYLLNKPHLLSHLKEENDAETQIEQWLDNIKSVSVKS